MKRWRICATRSASFCGSVRKRRTTQASRRNNTRPCSLSKGFPKTTVSPSVSWLSACRSGITARWDWSTGWYPAVRWCEERSRGPSRQVSLALTEHGEKTLEKLSAAHKEQLRRIGTQIEILLKRASEDSL